ncbi:hypothetical protein [Xylophilus sp. ASV27]|uniref:hypothetical protein n=1 Tax=Xylophilus sp. ASV27 TaxID=2795129 RepID=UPI0018ECE055|nr:hypothetical protein [Xylophilus sp. ASV27]
MQTPQSDSTPLPDLAVQASSSYFLVTQVKSHRVVYFTDDIEYQPPMEGDWYYISHFHGPLPEGMTLRNCWRWRFNGGVFIDAQTPAAKPQQELLLESNRKALRRILLEKINAVRASQAPKGTLGASIRAEKLRQANAYIAQPEECGDIGFLHGVALARGLSLLEAAQLIICKAADTWHVLQETEQVLEQFTVAIQGARTQEALLAVRESLLQDAYPALSRTCRYPVANTVPIDVDRPLGPVHLCHEKARLRTLLVQHINKLRKSEETDCIAHSDISERRYRAAKAFLQFPGTTSDENEIALLNGYAAAQEIALEDAARQVLKDVSQSNQLLAWSENERIRLLRHISIIRTLADIRRVEATIHTLSQALPASDQAQCPSTAEVKA